MRWQTDGASKYFEPAMSPALLWRAPPRHIDALRAAVSDGMAASASSTGYSRVDILDRDRAADDPADLTSKGKRARTRTRRPTTASRSPDTSGPILNLGDLVPVLVGCVAEA